MLRDDKVFYELCFNSLLEGICITNERGEIIMNNDSLEKIFQYKKGELQNKNISLLIPSSFRNIHLTHLHNFYKNPSEFHKGEKREFYGLCKFGEIIPIEIGLNYLDYNGKIYAKATISDISKRRSKEKKIIEDKFLLEKEVKKKTKKLSKSVIKLKRTNLKLKEEIQNRIYAEEKVKKAYEREKELSILKTKFLSLASHEFKTPLSGVFSSAILIEKYNDKKPNQKIRDHVQTIKNLVKQLNSVLDDFLFLEKTENQKISYHYSSFMFADFLNEIICNTKTVLKKGQAISFQKKNEDVEVFLDKNIIQIIFRNMLYNAIKYSSERSKIKVNFSTDTFIKISIKDHGIGIPKEDQKHIFERFFRAKNAMHLQGTGIGLNIVKYHIQKFGGSIHFESKESKGTTFTVKLPLRTKMNLN